MPRFYFQTIFLICIHILRVYSRSSSYYDILGIKKNSDENEIQKAFRKLSKQFHPDKNKNDKTASEKYIKLSEAYDVLMDPEKRQKYDVCGKKALESARESDICNKYIKKAPEMHFQLLIGLEKFYNGGETTINFQNQVICHKCKGNGGTGVRKVCPVCKGNGIVYQYINVGNTVYKQQIYCSHCNGKGKIYEHKCSLCSGSGVVSKQMSIEVRIERGAALGSDVLYKRKGFQRPGHIQGDVRFILKGGEHHFFKREGNDLTCEVQLTMRESLIGFKKEIIHLDGSSFIIESKGVTSPGTVKTYKNKGMPLHEDSHEYGNLRIKFSVKFPNKLSDSQINSIEKLF